ncbi:MAG: hypothetical protein RID07_01865, partial [Lacipirellulaceae bacterium]
MSKFILGLSPLFSLVLLASLTTSVVHAEDAGDGPALSEAGGDEKAHGGGHGGGHHDPGHANAA